jgi:AraC-like DNA-binding protein
MAINHNLGNAVRYQFVQTDEQAWLKGFSGYLINKDEDVELTYPIELATGFAKAGSTENGMSHLLVNYTLNNDLVYEKKASDDFQVSIYFYQFESDQPIEIDMNGKLIKSEQKNFDAILVTGNTKDQALRLKTGTSVKGLTINITEDWIQNNMNLVLLPKIMSLKQGHHFFKLLSEKERTIINALMKESDEKLLLPRTYVNNRILRLLEQVLLDVAKRADSNALPENINSADFQNIMQIERFLLSIYKENFPSISTLARKAYMSETKLKRLFKQFYSMGMYEYYQKNRMHKAKEMLLTTQKSITEVGNIIGYINLSNFSSAFRKEFNCLPKNFQLAD